MQKGIVFIAKLGAGNKKAHIFGKIVSLCPANDFSRVLYLTPAAFSQREARRQFFSYVKTVHKKRAYIPFQSFTLTHFCSHLYDAFHEQKIISDRIEPLILCEVLGERNIGYATILSNLLSKIRHHILDKELNEIKEELKSLIFEEKTMMRAVKALEVLELYEKELEDKGLITPEGAMKGSRALLSEHMNRKVEHRTQNTDKGGHCPYIAHAILVLDGFFDPTPLELEVLRALLGQSEKVFVLVEESAEFLNFFESAEHEFEKKILEPARHRAGAGYYGYPSMEEEVEGIAKGLKSLILEGTSPNEIIVSFPTLMKYLPMLKRIFKKYGIPISIGEYDLSASKPFVAIEDMIACIENDYPRNEFLSFVTSVHFPGIPEVLKKQAVSFSRMAGIVKGKQAWLSIQEILLNSSEEEISPEMGKIIAIFQQEIKKTIQILEGLKQEKNLSVFTETLEGILDTFGFFDSLEESSPGIDRKDTSQAISDLLSQLKHFAEVYHVKESGIEGWGMYLLHLLRGLKGSAENIHGVRVVPLEFAAGLESRALFFGGMAEGEFPLKPGIDPIMPEKVKEKLGLPFLEYYLERQKRYFNRLLHVSSDDPYFSYPSADGDKILLPSPFLEWGMNLKPPAWNISTEEEILVGNGASRHRDFSETLLNGEVPHEKEVASFLKKRLGSRVFFSVTDIDSYRRCPLRFYIERVLCLEVQEPPSFEIEAKLWGKLAHKTMESLYKEGVIELEDIGKKIAEGIEAGLQKFPIGNFWSKVAREIFQRLLPLIKGEEAEIRRQGFTPYKVEETIRATVNGMNLKGKIDRIDKKSQISSRMSRDKSQNGEVILLDYKTGSIDNDSLQLPLYAAMWQKIYPEPVEKVGYYSLKGGKVDWYPKKLGMDEIIQDALQTTEVLIQNMRKGIFTPAPFHAEDCRYCYHSALCKK